MTQRRLLLATGAAATACVAAVVAALGPAKAERAEYVWPPPTLPDERPEQGWYAPLPLLNRVPSSIVVQLPCGMAPLGDGRTATVVATARRPERTDAFRLALAGDLLRVHVGRSQVTRVPWPASCPLRLEVEDGELRLPDRSIPLRTPTPEHMPIVTGLFSTIDLRAAGRPEVVVRTRDYATSSTPIQLAASLLAIVLAGFALFLVLSDLRRRSRRLVRRAIRDVARKLGVVDAVVVGAVALWWIVAPAYSDDGWFATEYRIFGDLGADTFYYDHWGVIRPVGYWLSWLSQWVIGSSTDLVYMRLPIVLILIATWLLCRACLGVALGGEPARRARWLLAGAFLVGATAWGMTLRPEPVVAFLTLVVLAAMMWFVREQRTLSLVIAGVALVLALTAHPTGVVAAAPLIAGIPGSLSVLRGSRRDVFGRAAIALLSLSAVALVLFTLDADLAHRLSDARVVRERELHGRSFWDEHIRYQRFSQDGGGTSVRELSLLLMVLPVAAAISHGRSVRDSALRLPAWSVGLGLGLLAFVPSKWPWHFGALAAIAAVAAAVEVERLARERRGTRALVAVVVTVCLALVVWSAPGRGGSAFELQTVSWRDGFNEYTWLVVVVVPFVAATAASILLPRRPLRWPKPSAIASSMVLCVSFAAVGISMGLFAVDAARASWSPARQNLDALAGRDSCGLAHQLEIDGASRPSNAVLIHPSVGVYFPCAAIPRVVDGRVDVPAALVLHRNWYLLIKTSPFTAASDLYELRRVAGRRGEVTVYLTRNVIPGFVRADAIVEASG